MNGSQARTYLTLLAIGTASIREISKASGISRPDAYRAITHLEQDGLVERIILVPTKYKPIPVFDGLSILLGRKDKENIDLQNKAAKLYEIYKQNKSGEPAYNVSQQYVMIPEGKALTFKLKKIFENAEKSISIQFPRKMLLPLFLNDETVEKALKRNVEIRVLTERNPQFKIPKSIIDLTQEKNFKVRYSSDLSFVSFAIRDHKEALLPLSSDAMETESPAIWSSNPNFIEFAQNYFDTEWFAASQQSVQFENLISEVIGGFSYNQIIIDSGDQPDGFVLLKANGAFLEIFNLTENGFGKKTSQPFPGAEKEPALKQALSQIANGKITRFEYKLRYQNRWYSLLIFTPQIGYFTMVVKELSEKR